MVLLATCLGASGAQAEDTRRVEASALYQNVTGPYETWRGVTVSLLHGQRTADLWRLDATRQSAFGDRGTYLAVSNTRAWTPLWISEIAVGHGTGDFFFPGWRYDFNLGRKLLPDQSLVVRVGFTYVQAQQTYRDRAWQLSAAWYLPATWILESGVRFNRSTPGNVATQRGFIGVTYGTWGATSLSLRYTGGSEGYQLTDTASTLVDFASNEWRAEWRRWFAPSWGTILVAERYRNATYIRGGLTLGVFYDW